VTSHFRCRAALAGALVSLAAVAGCSVFKSGNVPLDSSAGLFDKARLRYEVDTDRVNSTAAPRRGEGQLVSYQQQATPRLPVNARASVDIRYPHPNKREGMAQVQVRIKSHAGKKSAEAPAWKRWWLSTRDVLPGWNDAGSANETWVLDIPKSELATIVSRLNTSGYFAGYEKSEGTEIVTELDGSKVAKSWHQVPEIDALVMRVRTEGRLVSSSGARNKPEAKEPFASVAIYRSLLAKDKKIAPAEEGFAMATDEASPIRPVQHLEIVRLPAVGGPVR
jgi:hypothetical protein